MGDCRHIPNFHVDFGGGYGECYGVVVVVEGWCIGDYGFLGCSWGAKDVA